MSILNFIFVYSWTDLFSSKNIGGSIINILQILFLVSIATCLITFSESFSKTLSDQIGKFDKLKITPNMEKGQTGIKPEHFKIMERFIWSNTNGKNGEVKIDKSCNCPTKSSLAYEKIIARNIVSFSKANKGFLRQFYALTISEDDPVMDKLGLKNKITSNKEAQIIIEMKTLKRIGWEEGEKYLTFDNWKEKFKIVYIDEENRLPYKALISGEWYENYWEKYNKGNQFPDAMRVEIYPKNFRDIIPLSLAVEKMGYKYDKEFYQRVDGIQKTKNFIKYSILLINSVLILAVTISVVLNFRYILTKKKKEIGYLRAYGLNKGKLKLIYIIEGFILCAFGTMLGILVYLIFENTIEKLINEGFSLSVDLSIKYATYPLSGIISLICFLIIIATVFAINGIVKESPAKLLKE